MWPTFEMLIFNQSITYLLSSSEITKEGFSNGVISA